MAMIAVAYTKTMISKLNRLCGLNVELLVEGFKRTHTKRDASTVTLREDQDIEW